MEEISMNVLWILIYVPMGFVKTYVVVTVVIATVAMNQMPLEETVLTLMNV
uniref:Alternative protein FBN2 n=1 Tax=Homo sapiens TaxID=9606 RepID=L8E8V5_HUMAN|nr:alternative protein FBN2 [Homo sapiens]